MEGLQVSIGHLNTAQHAAIGGTVVAVVEQADIPASAEAIQKTQQGTGALGEFNTQQSLILRIGATTDHIAQWHLGHFVVAKIMHRQFFVGQFPSQQILLLLTTAQLHAHEDMGLGPLAVAVVTLVAVARAQALTDAK